MTRPACFILACVLCVSCSELRTAKKDPPSAADWSQLAGKNILPGEGFETAAEDAPAGWQPKTWQGKGAFSYTDDGRNDGKCVVIDSSAGGDLSWQTTVAVRPGKTYLLSGWVKTEKVVPTDGAGALLNIHEVRPARTKAVSGTADWTRLEAVVRTGPTQKKLTVNCLFGGWGHATGKAWFDDVSLAPLALEDVEPAVVVAIAEKRPPLHPFIYGQFIEHLGRCIYGGIWAEMLEDRKFYFPVTPDYNPYRGAKIDDPDFIPVVGASPWEITGKPGGVTMVRTDSFVGEHAPRVAAGSGIRQNHLALEKGKKYTGHIQLKPAGNAASSVTVALTGCDGTKEITREPGGGYRRVALAFAAKKTTANGRLSIAVETGAALIGTVSLMPADNVEGMRPDTLRLLKELDGTMYRWPGGNFVSGYDWRDGIGPRDRRPPRKNPAWTGVEHNDFGIDEFIAFCRAVDAEPVIAVNTGFGDAFSAAQEVEYCNGSPDTPGGALRARNGHRKPYNVTYWCVGNEMFGPWQLGYMKLSHYTLKHNRAAAKMLAADPSLKLIGVGDLGRVNKKPDPREKRGWSRGMLEQCADRMDLISEHFYCGNQDDTAAHVGQLREQIRRKAAGHRKLQAELDLLPERKVPIAMDEWNYWHRPYIYGELGCRYRLKDALGVAAAIQEYGRNTDIITMAHYAQTVNVIGCIKTTKTKAFFATTGVALKMYRRLYGTVPVSVAGNARLLDIDVAAALTGDGKTLTIGAVNPNPRGYILRVDLSGATPSGGGTAHTVAGEDPDAFNSAAKQAVAIENGPLKDPAALPVPAYSASIFRIPLKE